MDLDCIKYQRGRDRSNDIKLRKKKRYKRRSCSSQGRFNIGNSTSVGKYCSYCRLTLCNRLSKEKQIKSYLHDELFL